MKPFQDEQEDERPSRPYETSLARRRKSVKQNVSELIQVKRGRGWTGGVRDATGDRG